MQYWKGESVIVLELEMIIINIMCHYELCSHWYKCN